MAQDHRIEPLAREVAVVLGFTVEWSVLGGLTKSDCRRLAAFIIAREEKRVGPLVEALDKAIQCAKWQYEMRTKEAPDSPPHSLFWELDTVLANYRALDAPPAPEPSLDEAVAPVLARACHERDCPSACPRSIPEVCTCGLKEARAALAREREKESRRG